MPVVFAKVPGIAPNKGAAQALVSHLVMQTVFDVLENQSRSAVLPDAVILNLGQLEVKVDYEATLRSKVVLSLMEEVNNEEKCIIIQNTITGICSSE
ncbi:hypothetical protein KIN20_011884 [Parelaphostrongylus tenuis]|uniref:Uncharacterized protein n=1 Tax=Parelaphostrongylus tenuis TaxID=148309 RepID=A0AAD5MEN2_PARTN|nr:hypothetical protein KIN20_011884 [Parelaphostrongylus tenuis]